MFSRLVKPPPRMALMMLVGWKSGALRGGPRCMSCTTDWGAPGMSTKKIFPSRALVRPSEGTDFGPDLSQIAKKYDRAQILEQILWPSRIIEPNFIAYSIETNDDLSYSGLILKRTADEIVLKDANAKEIRLRAADVKSVQAQSLSVMPELLLQALTAQNVADLVDYLSSLR